MIEELGKFLGNRVVRSIPTQLVNLPLVGPVLRLLDESQTDRIPTHVFMLLVISLRAPDTLSQWSVMSQRIVTLSRRLVPGSQGTYG